MQESNLDKLQSFKKNYIISQLLLIHLKMQNNAPIKCLLKDVYHFKVNRAKLLISDLFIISQLNTLLNNKITQQSKSIENVLL